eukprot:Gregarina_sp_Pseudo_9__76@NODE_1051_length_1929_cov_19_898413_g984_i0_p2_GENE_NODE_1051_length_1929_cov_19_898413_g984_i0NODE_1051_length_1929_cov_19_898413_g984_i0_p2_ORF_typecomplete_len186_score40_45DCP1/PF06058_13/5_7e27WH1/PF00568_23/0_0016Phyto_Pns9_10/PF05878_11/0_094_NODE_1051_length_1929_cov_19_898413_g984_i081638
MPSDDKPVGDAAAPAEAYSQNKQLGFHIIRAHDPDVANIIALTTFVSVYQFDDSTNTWHRANVEGFLFLIQRKTPPLYRLIVLNQKNQGNLVQDIDASWDLTNEINYIFFRKEDSDGELVTRGLWFYEDEERIRMWGHLKRIVSQLKETRAKRGTKSSGATEAEEEEEVSETMVAALLRRIVAGK